MAQSAFSIPCGYAYVRAGEGDTNAPGGAMVMLQMPFRPVRRTFVLPACAVCALALLPAPAAADGAATGSDPAPEVVVTARKRPELAADVPLALSRIDGEVLRQRNLSRIDDLEQLAPGLNISYFNPRGNYVSIRGLGRNPASDGLEPAVGVFLDGVYLGRPGMAVQDLTDIAAVEVLRGPQGTLFGKNTTAGAIVISTREPTFTPEASGEVTGGTLGTLQLRGTASTALVDDRLALRLALYHTGQEGAVRALRADGSDSGTRLNGTDRSGGRVQLLFVPSPADRVRLAVDLHREADSCCTLVAGSFGPASASYLARVAAAGGTAILGGRDYATTANAATFLRVRQGGGSATWVHDFGASALTAITGYREWHYRAGFDGDLSSADGYVSAAVPSDDWQVSQEIRLANRSGGRLEWTGGLYYFRQRLRSALQLAFGGRAANFLGNSPAPPPFLLGFDNLLSETGARLDSETFAAFGQLDWHPDPRFALSAGLRGTHERKWGTIFRPANAVQSAYLQRLSLGETDPSGTLALTWTAAPTVHVYASYAHATKAGGINPVVDASSANQIVRPERADSLELGLKATLAGGRAHASLAAFATRIGNYQATLNRLFRAVLTNVGQVSTRGAEVAADWRATGALTLTLNAAYADARSDRYPDAPCPPEAGSASGCDLSGRPLADAPRWIVNASARYHHRLGHGSEASLAADYAFKSAYNGNIDHSAYARLPARSVINAQAELTLDRLATSVELWVKNLTDTRALESYPLGGATIYGAYFGTITPPRTYGVTISHHL